MLFSYSFILIFFPRPQPHLLLGGVSHCLKLARQPRVTSKSRSPCLSLQAKLSICFRLRLAWVTAELKPASQNRLSLPTRVKGRSAKGWQAGLGRREWRAGPRGHAVSEGRGLKRSVGGAKGGPAPTEHLLVNGAREEVATGRVLCAAAVLELSQEAATYRSLLCLIVLF